MRTASPSYVAFLFLTLLASSTVVDGANPGDDVVEALPTFAGKLPSPIYAGYAPVSRNVADLRNQLFYMFVQAETNYNAETPTLIWLNGGPGASSLMGFFVEHIGPFDMTVNGTLALNPYRLSKHYNLLAVDNPVGAGFSYTKNGAYVKSEEEMRSQFVLGLRHFFARHPELLKHPLWVTGESYAGKYIPNIVTELDAAIAGDKQTGGQFSTLDLKGMIIGNGMYNETEAYRSVAAYAYTAGVIDEATKAKVEGAQEDCIKQIQAKVPTAGDYCENVTVRYIYWNVSQIPMYYDLGLTDMDLDSISEQMGKYLSRDDVKKALHTTGHTWTSEDEVGPVAEALMADFTIPSMPLVINITEKGYRVALYNGVRDGSVCNHIGGENTLLAADKLWKYKGEFLASKNELMWFEPPSGKKYVMAYNRIVKNFSFTKVMRTGHLVPTVVPEQFAVYVAWVTGHPASGIKGVVDPAFRGEVVDHNVITV